MKKTTYLIVLLLIGALSISVYGQNNAVALKNEALQQMRVGRYGEAIDLLNRYISANPQTAEGYNLRGECHEKRKQYVMAVYDYRSARKLEPNNSDINKNLSRAINAWYKLLYNKIEGHRREIAINPNKPINYLEIGKCYKNLGEWLLAEEWYDEYLKREEASADEIIRYTEILAKNGHIAKGEPILKRYTEKYPNDHRLWSRYGYFVLWLGKNQLAIEAFETALELRPYFKEAMDGLDQAKGKGYIYTVNDTSARYNYGMPTYSSSFEYPIDRYYRVLKKNPDDIDTRWKLVKALVEADRYGEAFDQLAILEENSQDIEGFEEYRDNLKAKRDSIYAIKIEEYKTRFESNASNKDVAIQLADYYSGLQEYDSALDILDRYLAATGSSADPEVRYRYAQYATWNYEFEKAIDQLDILLAKYPDNLDYQLLRAQIGVWTVQDMDLAEEYLKNILNHDPNNVQALVSLASMNIRYSNFDIAKEYLDKATSLDPESKEVEAIQIYYDVSLSNWEGLQIYQILYDARDLVAAGDCVGAVEKYDEYFSKITAPTRFEKIEYANVNVCAENYETALNVYNELLDEEYDYDLAVMRARALLWTGDSTQALVEFKKLYEERPDDFDAKLNLAIAYEHMHEYDEAEDLYDQLLEQTEDSTKIVMLEQRKGWLPSSSFTNILGSFPSYVALAPNASYYKDNQNFQFSNVGGRLEVGLTSFLSVGASLKRTTMENTIASINMTTLKWNLFLRPIENLTLSAGFGTLNSLYFQKRNVHDMSLRYEDKDKFAIYGMYENTDAKLLLYSPNLLFVNYDANMYRIGGYYNHKSGLKINGLFGYLTIADGNEGNDFRLRIGKEFYENFIMGYEYFFVNYALSSYYYYSPQNFDSHSLYADWTVEEQDNFKAVVGGKLGYVSIGDFIIREIYGEVSYEPFEHFFLNGRITGGSTYRYESSYNFLSATMSAYWSFW